MMRRIWAWCKGEAVLCIALLLSLFSMLFVPPDAAYAGYIDPGVLLLLFSLMAAVQGFIRCNLFQVLAARLLAGEKPLRLICLLLVLLPFFLSMLVTNDVALIALVPFSFLALRLLGEERLMLRISVLQTVAANLGSMATPVGNPQNLFLHAHYALSAGAFFRVVLPFSLLSLLLVGAGALFSAGPQTVRVRFETPVRIASPWRLGGYICLFGLSLLSVFHAVHQAVPAAAGLLFLLLFDRPLLRRIDYGLLATFVCFFVFSGNLGRIDAVRALLSGLLQKNALLTAVLTSQFISNVPAAILLSGFTTDWPALLAGVNIGGLGTPIASLASLISLRLYLGEPEARAGRYLAVFTAVNALCLLLLLAAAALVL